MQTYRNKRNLTIIKKYQHYQNVAEQNKLMELKYDHFIMYLPHNSCVSTISIIQRNSDVIKNVTL